MVAFKSSNSGVSMLPLKELLEKLGLSEKETALYLFSLELGAQPASILSKRANMNRSTTYLILNGLMKKGLMSSYERKKITYYNCVHPRKLLFFVDRQRSHFDECRREIEDLLPSFENLKDSLINRPKVSFFDGAEGIKSVMEDTLTSSETIRCYSSLHRWLEGELSNYIRDYGQRRIFGLGIPLKALLPAHNLAKDYLKNEYPIERTETRFMPKDIDVVDNEINIYDNKVAIVSLKPGDYFGVIIESPQIAQTQKAIFELAWLGALPKDTKISRKN